MISLSYINGTEVEDLSRMEYDNLTFPLYESSFDLDHEIDDYIDRYKQCIFEHKIMKTDPKDDLLVLEKEQDNIFKKIGESIIKLFKTLYEFIDKRLKFIKDKMFSSKSNVEKLDKYLKTVKDEKIREDIICKFENGELDINDAKNIKEISAAYDELVKLARKKDIDPDSFAGKVDAFKRKLENIDKTAVIKTAGAVTVIVTAAIAVITFRSKVVQAQNTIESAKDDIQKRKNENIFSYYEELNKTTEGKERLKKMSVFQLEREAANLYTGKLNEIIRRQESIVTKFSDGINKFFDKRTVQDAYDSAKRQHEKLDRDTRDKKYHEELGRRDAGKADKYEYDFKVKYTQLDAENKWKKKHPDKSKSNPNPAPPNPNPPTPNPTP